MEETSSNSPFQSIVAETILSSLRTGTQPIGQQDQPATTQQNRQLDKQVPVQQISAPPAGAATPPAGAATPPAGAATPPAEPVTQRVDRQPPAVPTDIAKMFMEAQAQNPTPASIPEVSNTPIQDPEGLNEKANYAWKELRARERALRDQNAAYRAEIDRIMKEAKAVSDERVKFADELKQRDDKISKLTDELGRLDLTHKPEFREKYDKPLGAVSEQVVALLKDETDIDDEQKLTETASRLMEVNDSEFNRLVANLPASVQGSLLDKRRTFREITAARDHAISEWRTTQDGVDATAEQNRVVERSERRRDMAERAIDFIKVKTPADKRLSVLSEQTYAGDVETIDQSFRGFMQQAEEKDIAVAAYQGFLMPVVQRQIAYLVDAVNQWRTAYHMARGLSSPPVFPVNGGHAAPVTQKPPEKPLTPAPSFKEVVNETVLGALRGVGIGS